MLENRRKNFFEELKREFIHLADALGLKEAKVEVKASPLKPEDAIGAVKRQDYVLLKGKEKLLEATVMGCRGQAFTSAQGDFKGTLEEVLSFDLENDFQRAVYVAVLNAIALYAGKTEKTVHCRNEGPELCAQKAADYFKGKYGNPRILMVGYQPALAEALNNAGFSLTVLDLDSDNIGKNKNGVLIQNGRENLSEHIASCDVIFATGSTICNATIDNFYNTGKPLVFFGTTGAGAAALLGIERFCPESMA
ncbi:DUF364 domain-containing protein [Thermosyntropha sp.]|uniref:Rossmann-like domain-containing protein n=1 Tax=Thermosyntropha sp. TaxID=2740820 RepID=UPI0025CD20FE|nr:DUF364 domain-containing protein [Thermosyntropha sp.]MBO8158239.1 hypothetical protein [Thermosyntropha sp.]